MKATFALLADSAVGNLVNKMAWQLHRAHRTGISCRRLPPHVSLKQPFDVADLDALEVYMEQLAVSIASFPVELGACCLWETPPENPTSGILFIQVTDAAILRALHDRLNRELTERFGPCKADFDGDAYAFHLTVVAGEGTLEAYRKAFAEASRLSDFPTFAAREIALFVYDRDENTNEWEYMTYKVLPLSRPA